MKAEKTKPHGLTGKRNAAKASTVDAFIACRVPDAVKVRAQAIAGSQGMKLGKWAASIISRAVEDDSKRRLACHIDGSGNSLD